MERLKEDSFYGCRPDTFTRTGIEKKYDEPQSEHLCCFTVAMHCADCRRNYSADVHYSPSEIHATNEAKSMMIGTCPRLDITLYNQDES